MSTEDYNRRVVALFKSGGASEAQWAELVEAVGCAFDKNIDGLGAIHEGIGFEVGEVEEAVAA